MYCIKYKENTSYVDMKFNNILPEGVKKITWQAAKPPFL